MPDSSDIISDDSASRDGTSTAARDAVLRVRNEVAKVVVGQDAAACAGLCATSGR